MTCSKVGFKLYFGLVATFPGMLSPKDLIVDKWPSLEHRYQLYSFKYKKELKGQGKFN